MGMFVPIHEKSGVQGIIQRLDHFFSRVSYMKMCVRLKDKLSLHVRANPALRHFTVPVTEDGTE